MMKRALGLWRQVRERRLFQIVVSYTAAGWVIVQVVSNLVQHGVLPAVAYLLALVWYIGGFPAALLIGWYHGERGDQKAPALEVFSLAVVAVICLGLSSVAVSRHLREGLAAEAAENGLALTRIAVPYFRDLTAGGEQLFLAEGLTEDLITELGRVSALDVVSVNGVAPFRGASLPADSIGRIVDAGTVVDGSVERTGDRIRVNVRVLDASGSEFERVSFEHAAADVRAIRSSVVEESSRMLRAWLGEAIQLRNRRAEAENPAAWALVQRAEKTRRDGESFLRHDDLEGMDREFDRADVLLAQAELLDPEWDTPILLRGHIAHRRARLAHEPVERRRWIAVGLEHTRRALALTPESPRALELRGLLRYWAYLQDDTPDPEERRRLLLDAREDLEAAVRIDPSLADAHSALSHLYYQFDDVVGVVLSARRAYEEDAYLDAANSVLWRLVTGLYDLQQFTESRRWCAEGERRFPDDHRFAECRLLLMTTPEEEPDVERAWSLARRLASVSPEPRRAHETLKAELLAAGVIARAGNADSARAVLDRAGGRLDHTVDPSYELLLLEAYMRVLAGDADAALERLRQYTAVNPAYSFDHNWWWDRLRPDPRFGALTDAAAAGGGDAH